MAKFEMISMKVLVENEGLRHYLAGAPAVTDAKKGGTFVGNRDIAPAHRRSQINCHGHRDRAAEGRHDPASAQT